MLNLTTAVDTAPEPITPDVAKRRPLDGAIWVPPNLLKPSPTNPRKTFAPARTEEMAESLKAHGQISPIIVRPNPDGTPEQLAIQGRPLYEIVAGERRWRGATLAKLPGVMVIVREMSDIDVLQVQLIENLAREDLEPLEEAEGYAALLSKTNQLLGVGARNVDDLAARIGKSRRYVYNRLKLNDLCPQGRDALASGKLAVATAQIVAGLPDKGDQAKAVERILIGFGGEPMSFRTALDYIAREFMLRLDKAPFMVEATYKAGGPCAECPKRSGAHGDLFADVASGDMCQDSACYQAKATEAHDIEIEQARKAGYTVLDGSKAAAVLSSPSGQPIGHRRLDQPCPELTKSIHPLGDVLGPKFRPVIALDHPQGGVIYVAPEANVRRALQAKGLLRQGLGIGEAENKAAPPDDEDQEHEHDEAPAATTAAPAIAASEASNPSPPKLLTPKQMIEAATQRSGELFGRLMFERLHEALVALPELPRAPLAMMVVAAAEDLSFEALSIIYRVRGWPIPLGVSADFRDRAIDSSGRQLGELLIELMLLAEDLTDGRPLSEMHYAPALDLAHELAIDPKAIEKEADLQAAEQIRAEQVDRQRLAAAAKRAKMLPPGGGEFSTGPDRQERQKRPGGNARPPVKYRNPATGETWSGRGLQPRWLKACLAAGHRIEEYSLAANADAATEAFVAGASAGSGSEGAA